MRNLLTIAAVGLLASGCTIPQSFESMSNDEIFAYNKGRPVMEQIYCVKEARTSSRIRKTYCDTVATWVEHNQRTLSAIQVMSVNSSYSPFGSQEQGHFSPIEANKNKKGSTLCSLFVFFYRKSKLLTSEEVSRSYRLRSLRSLRGISHSRMHLRYPREKNQQRYYLS